MMKSFIVILAAGMVLFSTIYSSAWCMCGTRSPAAVSGCCTGGQDSGRDTDHHCPRYENRIEAITAVTEYRTVTECMAGIPLTAYNAAVPAFRQIPVTAMAALHRDRPGPERHTVLRI